MANLIGLVAPSGFGKSSSLVPNEELKIKGLNPKETVIINVAGKPLPMKGFRSLYPSDKMLSDGGNYLESSDSKVICDALQYISKDRKEIKNVVIDDAQYLMAFMFMSKAKEKGFDKFNEIAQTGFNPINVARTLRSDLNVIITYHQEKGDDGRDKIKTVGKMVDNAISLEGLFTVILYATVERDMKSGKTEYRFMTNTDGNNTAKSPVGMFPSQFIPNDMGYVLDKMNEYYN